MPFPYPINCRDTALPCPLYHSDAAGIDITVGAIHELPLGKIQHHSHKA